VSVSFVAQQFLQRSRERPVFTLFQSFTVTSSSTNLLASGESSSNPFLPASDDDLGGLPAFPAHRQRWSRRRPERQGKWPVL